MAGTIFRCAASVIWRSRAGLAGRVKVIFKGTDRKIARTALAERDQYCYVGAPGNLLPVRQDSNRILVGEVPALAGQASNGGRGHHSLPPPREFEGGRSTKKKKRDSQNSQRDGKWTKVPIRLEKQEEKRRKKKKEERKLRMEAIILKPAEGKTYAEILGVIRRQANLSIHGLAIKDIRQTQKGDVLIELKQIAAENKKSFINALKQVVGQNASVSSHIFGTILEIRDVDSSATPDEVKMAILGTLKEYTSPLEVRITGANKVGKRLALVTVTEEAGKRPVADSVPIG